MDKNYERIKTKIMIIFKASLKVHRHYVLKNNKQIVFNRKTRRSFIKSSDEVIEAKEYLVNMFRSLHDGRPPIGQYVNLKCLFYFPKEVFFNKKGERSKRVPDTSNLYQIVEDALEEARVIENDRLIESHNGSLRLPGDEFILDVEISMIPLIKDFLYIYPNPQS